VILYMLLSGMMPFMAKTKKELLEQIEKGEFNFKDKEWANVSEKAKTFIKKMMTIDPNNRLSAEEALNDPWITETLSSTSHDAVLAESALSHLRTYRAEKKLQEAFWVYISSYFTRVEEKSQYLTTFRGLDANGDGTLTKEELLKGFKEVSKTVYSEEEIDEILKAADTNGNGVIDYSEFIAAAMKRKAIVNNNRLEGAFKLFDKDGNGEITIDEVKERFNPGEKNINDKKWLDLIKEVDKNNDHKISYQEFKDLIMKVVSTEFDTASTQ